MWQTSPFEGGIEYVRADLTAQQGAETPAESDVERDAERYRWLRARDLDTIHMGGVFAGLTPDNMVLNGVDLDEAVDTAMGGTE